uniref:Uncharacterized protein n=1 Tax=Romanomermis culicivorax TaxID=13658 RepID=A0A915J1M6_ROMCU
MQCDTKCQPPLVSKFCGAKAATTVQNLYLSMFHSINSILSTDIDLYTNLNTYNIELKPR